MKTKWMAMSTLLTVGILTLPTMAASVNIYGSPAPNAAAGASSFAAWWTNAQTAVYNGLTSYGTGNAEYIQVSSTGGTSDVRPAYEAVVTGFDSWHGVAGGTGEWGTRTHFIYHIKADPSEAISLANIVDIDILEDGWGDIDYSLWTYYTGGPIDFNASTTFDAARRVGYTVNGSVVTSGTAEAWNIAHPGNEITDIIGTFGMAYDTYFPNNNYYGGTTAQEELDLIIADMAANLQNWTGTITYNGTVVETTVTFVPEPAALGLLALGGLALLRRRG